MTHGTREEELPAPGMTEAEGPAAEKPPRAGKQRSPRPGEVRPKLELSITASLSILAVLGMVALLYYAASVFITVFSSILIAIALGPAVEVLCVKARLSRHVASMIVVFLAIALLYGVLYAVYANAAQLFSDLPTLLEQIRRAPLVQEIARKAQDATESFQEAMRGIGPAAPPAKGGAAQVVIRDGNSWADTLLHGIGSITTIVFSLSFIPFLVYFILAEKDDLTWRTLRLFPVKEEHKITYILNDLERMMQRFLVGNAIIAAVLSAATVLIFWLIGLPYFIVLGILSGVASTIPYLGLILAVIPGVLVGLVTFDSGMPMAVLVAGVTFLHLIAANLLVPKLVGSRTHLNAVTSTMALMFFGWLWGGMGLLLAIPIVAVLKSVLENVDSTRRLGEWLGDMTPRTTGHVADD